MVKFFLQFLLFFAIFPSSLFRLERNTTMTTKAMERGFKVCLSLLFFFGIDLRMSNDNLISHEMQNILKREADSGFSVDGEKADSGRNGI